MTFQIVLDMQPSQLVVDMSMKLGRDFFGLIKKPESDVHCAWEVVVASGERRPAGLAETARHAGIDANLAPFIWRERHVGAVEGGERRDRCAGHPPAVGAVAVRDGARQGSCLNARRPAIASTGDFRRRGVVDHGGLALKNVIFPETATSGAFGMLAGLSSAVDAHFRPVAGNHLIPFGRLE